jgi:hypothetical protein
VLEALLSSSLSPLIATMLNSNSTSPQAEGRTGLCRPSSTPAARSRASTLW